MSVAQTTAPISSLATATDRAKAQGLPETLFGFTPEQKEYWHEPGLPWFTAEMFQDHPTDNREGTPDYYKGWTTIPCIGDVAGDQMGPRFPRGCAVNTMPVYNKSMLVVGKVYTYRFINQETGEPEWNIARLVKVGGNYLEMKPDNDEQVSLWLLRDDEEKATWDVREVTHYASYPAEAE